MCCTDFSEYIFVRQGIVNAELAVKIIGRFDFDLGFRWHGSGAVTELTSAQRRIALR